VDEIRVLSLSQNDEWRLLHGRRIDVVPNAPPQVRSRFEKLASVRIVDLPSDSVYSLYFNPNDPTLSSVDVRRTIANSLRLDAIAEVGCAGDYCLRQPWRLPPPVTQVVLPTELSLLYLANDASVGAAAMVIRHQLGDVGITTKLVSLSLDDLFGRVGAGEYQMLLSPVRVADLATWFAPSNLFGYTDEALVAAVDSGDTERIAEALRAAALVAPLYEARAFAVIDEGWCGGAPADQVSWLWLADLYPCGER
jgi:hypothetical protein